MKAEAVYKLLKAIIDDNNPCRESLFDWCQNQSFDDGEVSLVFAIAAGEALDPPQPVFQPWTDRPWVERPVTPNAYPTIQPNIYTQPVPKQSPFGGPEVTC